MEVLEEYSLPQRFTSTVRILKECFELYYLSNYIIFKNAKNGKSHLIVDETAFYLLELLIVKTCILIDDSKNGKHSIYKLINCSNSKHHDITIDNFSKVIESNKEIVGTIQILRDGKYAHLDIISNPKFKNLQYGADEIEKLLLMLQYYLDVYSKIIFHKPVEIFNKSNYITRIKGNFEWLGMK